LEHTTLTALIFVASTIALLHTLLGPDHYVPFIAMSKAWRWSFRKTAIVTLLCGAGHVLSSVVVGSLGIALGCYVADLEQVESVRGNLAGWLFVGFGLAYCLWGIRQALRNQPHAHWHTHADGTVHSHPHVHVSDHAHVHDERADRSLTPWVLFTLFVFGPCEPLIPVLMYPAARHSLAGVAVVTFTFGAITLAAMLAMVTLGCAGLRVLPLGGLERYNAALAGLAVTTCGLAIQLGL